VQLAPELAQDGVNWVYAVVPFDEALDPIAPVGSTLDATIEPLGAVSVRLI